MSRKLLTKKNVLISTAAVVVFVVLVGVGFLIPTIMGGGNTPAASPNSTVAVPVTTDTTTRSVPSTTTKATPSATTSTTASEEELPPRTSKEVPPVPKPPAGLAPPVPNFASIEGAIPITLFERVTLPVPQTWAGTQGDPEMAVVFADQVTCTASAAECPSIQFVNLMSPYAAEYFGSDPVAQWKTESCRGSSQFPVEGPAALTLGGASAQFYQRKCNADETAYLWLVPDRQLLVIGTPGAQGALSPEIIQGALERVQWG